MRRTALARTLVFLAAGVAATGVGAQTFGDSPSVRALEARLEQEGVSFRATVFDAPDEDSLEYGRLVAMGGGRAQGSAGDACFSCHGADGNGDGSGAFPRLAGMPAWYLYKQLVDYASGQRPNDIMSPIAKNLSEAEMEAVSSYYAVLEPAYPESGELASGVDLQWGAKLSAVGSAERGVPACVNCHGPQSSGMPPSVPPLAGQYAEYIALQLNLWKEGVRRNDPVDVMSAIAKKMTDEDIEAVARYLERVHPVREAVPVVMMPTEEATRIRPPPGLEVETGMPGAPGEAAGTTSPEPGGASSSDGPASNGDESSASAGPPSNPALTQP